MKKICLFIGCLSIIAGLSGCGKNALLEDEAKEYAASFLDGYISQDKSISTYLSDSKDDISFDGFQGILAQNFEYSITDVEKENDTDRYIITLKATNVDFGKVFENVVVACSDNTTEEELRDLLEEGLSAENAPTKNFECTLNVEGTEADDLTVSVTETLSNAMLGGYPEFIDSYVTQQVEEEK